MVAETETAALVEMTTAELDAERGTLFLNLDYHTDEAYPHLVDAVGYFRDGLAQYRQGGWNDAVKQFSEVMALNPADKAAQLYVERCRYLEQHPPGDDWNGVWVMQSK